MQRRKAVITGATSGIGEAFARALGARGYDLLITGRRAARLEEVAATLSAAYHVAADIAVGNLAYPGHVAELADRVRKLEPDLLINNAGFAYHGPFADLPDVAMDAQIAVHCQAVARLTQAALAGMRPRASGHIINVASFAYMLPMPGAAVYAATKAFIVSFSESLAEELRGSGIAVQALCPAVVRTPLLDTVGVTAERQPRWGPHRVLRPEEVVRASLRQLWQGGDPICIPGAATKLQALLIRVAPRRATRRVVFRFLERMHRGFAESPRALRQRILGASAAGRARSSQGNTPGPKAIGSRGSALR